MFWASSCPSSGAQQTALAASGLPLECGDSSAVGCGWAGPTMTNCYHHAPTVNQKLLLQFVVAPDDGHVDARNILSCI